MTHAPRWLLSSGGRRGELLKLLQHNELTGKNEFVVVTDSSELAPTRYLSQEFAKVPRVSSEAFVDELFKISQKNNVNVILPTIDPELSILADEKEQFSNQGIDIWVSSPEVCELGWDKWKLYQWLLSQGFPTVKTAEYTNIDVFEGNAGLVAKPRNGSSSVGVMEVESTTQLALLNPSKDYIVQRVAPGVEITVDFAVDSRGRFLGSASRQRLEVRAGEVSKAVTVRIPAVDKLVSEIAMELPGAYGILNLQLFYDRKTQEINVIEINPRCGGGYPLSVAAGANFHRALLESNAGNFTPVQSKPGVLMLRYDSSVFTVEHNLDVYI